MTLDAQTRLARSREAAWQTIDGETVILGVRTRELVGLNRVAGRVWTLLDGTRSLASLVAAIATEFAQPAERVEPDVRAFLAELCELQLVVATV